MKFTRSLFVMAAFAASLASAAAFASDLNPGPAKAAAKYTPPFTWTGVYVGGDFGAGIMDNGPSVGTSGTLSSLVPTTASNHAKGYLGGIELGARKQWGVVVGGVRGTFQFADINITDQSAASQRSVLGGTSSGSSMVTTKLNWLSTAVATLGVTVMPNVLIELDAGLAFGKVSSTATTSATAAPFTNTSSLTCFFAGCSSSGSGTDSGVRTGWTAGLSAEIAMNERWSFKGQGNYFDLGSGNVNFTGANGLVGSSGVNYRGWDVLLGVNYKLF